MSATDKSMGIARVYARALLALADEQGKTAEVLGELGELAGLLERESHLAGFLESPLVGLAERQALIEKLLRGRLSDLVVDALQVMSQKGRLAILPTLIEAYRQEVLEASGQMEVQVTTAVALSPELRQRLQAAADRFTGKKTELIETVDPGVLAGLVLRVGNQKVDGTVAHQLARLSEALNERASREILKGREQGPAAEGSLRELDTAYAVILDRAANEILTGNPAGSTKAS
ncbi:MAG TPA: ATP synthase F1 subunit delta [Thermoanaerobaculia bacterium]|nr:ATP synthase F1 subunit delta [Thermoanaerobaculia bacterium]